ncbi:MAG: substrate-binding domain-containing protein [Chloroflexota bacterium]|nr:substrate-binding domain-containing protein [Chloroflexota bacterium]
MKHLGKSHLITLVIGLVLGAIALGAVHAAISVSSDVRIGVKRLNDGRVEVKLQQLDGETWVDLDTAAARFLPTDAEVDRWRYSSSIEVVGTVETQPVVLADPPVMCVHGHAHPRDDRFWRWVLASSDVAAYQYGVDVRLYGATDAEQHVNGIRDCMSHDPITIATSLPYAEELQEVLAEATAAGIHVVSFNSGADDAQAVGTLLHIGLDDVGGGERAGDEFNRQGVSGTLLCVVHEEDNVGLHDRCDGIGKTYEGGEVEWISVDVATAEELGAGHAEHSRPEHLQTLIAERIAEGDVGAILTLNHDSAVAAMAAIEEAEAEIALASFGFSDALADAVRDGKLLFVVWDHPVAQGYLAVSGMALAYTLELSRLNPGVFLNGAKILIEPTLANQERAAELKSMFAGPPPSPQDESGESDATGSESASDPGS